MNLILFCVFLTFSIGLFLLLAGLLRLPTLKTSRVMMDTGKEGKQLSKTLDAFYMDGAVKIAKYIRMNDYKKNRMANVLRASGLGMTPEVYTAYAYLKSRKCLFAHYSGTACVSAGCFICNSLGNHDLLQGNPEGR